MKWNISFWFWLQKLAIIIRIARKKIEMRLEDDWKDEQIKLAVTDEIILIGG